MCRGMPSNIWRCDHPSAAGHLPLVGAQHHAARTVAGERGTGALGLGAGQIDDLSTPDLAAVLTNGLDPGRTAICCLASHRCSIARRLLIAEASDLNGPQGSWR